MKRQHTNRGGDNIQTDLERQTETHIQRERERDRQTEGSVYK